MQIKIDRQEIERRLDAIRACMENDGLDLLVIHSSPLYSMYIHYASNYDLIGKGATVILPISGDPILYVSEAWDLDRAARVSPIADVRASSNLARACGEYLRSPRSAMAGIEWVDNAFATELIARAGREVPSASKLLERAAHRKTEIERELIRQAAALADIGFERGYNALVPGMPEYELAAEIEFGMRDAGAVDNFGLLSS